MVKKIVFLVSTIAATVLAWIFIGDIALFGFLLLLVLLKKDQKI